MRGVQLTDDSFRALARSTPWRFTALHFTRRSPAAPSSEVEAWLRRPGWLRVVLPDGSERIETGVPYSSSTVTVTATAAGGAEVLDVADRTRTLGDEPAYRPDGLVERRPEGWVFRHADPMFEDYRWVAMLDPAELADGVLLSDLREDVLFGRPVWRARVTAVDGYDPLCGCCSLLRTAAVDTIEWGAPRAAGYPSAYDVALDVGTGVLVLLCALDGPQRDDWIEVEIHGADQTANVPPLRQ